MDTITPVVDQTLFRGRDDDVGINVDTWNGGGILNGDWTQDVDVNFRIRFAIAETAGGEYKNKQYKIQFNLEAGGWTDVGAGTAIKYGDTTEYINLAITSQLIGSHGSFVAGDGVDNTNVTGNITILSEETEVEYVLQIDSAQVSDEDTFDLRVVEATDGELDNYDNTPTITVNEVVPVAYVRVVDETEAVGEGVLYPGAFARLVAETETVAEEVLRLATLVRMVDEDVEVHHRQDISTMESGESWSGGTVEATIVYRGAQSRWIQHDDIGSDGPMTHTISLDLSADGVIVIPTYTVRTIQGEPTPPSDADIRVLFTDGAAKTASIDLSISAGGLGAWSTEALPWQTQKTDYTIDSGFDWSDVVSISYDLVNYTEDDILRTYIDDVHLSTEAIYEKGLGAQAYIRVVDSTETVAENVVRATVLARQVDDTEAVTEEVIRAAAFTLTIIDSLSVYEHDTPAPLQDLIGSEFPSPSPRLIGFGPMLPSGVFTVGTFARLDDTDVEVGETVPRAGVHVRQDDDTEAITEGVIRATTLTRLADDTETITETDLTSLILRRIVDSTVEVAEADVTPGTYLRVLDETEVVSEEVLTPGTYLRVLDETEAITEAVLPAGVYLRVVDEDETIPEEVLRFLGAGAAAYVRIVGSTMEVAESVIRATTLTRQIDSDVDISETTPHPGTFARIDDSDVEVSEAPATVGTFVRDASSTVAVAEGTVTPGTFVRFDDTDVEISEVTSRHAAFLLISDNTVTITETTVAPGIYVRLVASDVEITDQAEQYHTILCIVDSTVDVSEPTPRTVVAYIRSVRHDIEILEATNTDLDFAIRAGVIVITLRPIP